MANFCFHSRLKYKRTINSGGPEFGIYDAYTCLDCGREVDDDQLAEATEHAAVAS